MSTLAELPPKRSAAAATSPPAQEQPDAPPTSQPIVPQLHRWTPEQFIQMISAGLFAEQRTELIDGEIYDVPSQHNPHVAGISKVNRLLVAAFDETYWLTVQSTVRLPRGDMPDPDFAVRPGPANPDQSFQPLPLLVIEVSDDTLLSDQFIKSSLYAANGIGDYWILNLPDRQLEVYRQPVADASRRHGWRYGQLIVLRSGDVVSPLVRPDIRIEVAKMLP